jgi:WD40 repeat protein
VTGGKDKKLYIWDITDLRKPVSEYDGGATINQIAFHPKTHWVAAATENEVRIWQVDGDKKPFCTLEHIVDSIY